MSSKNRVDIIPTPPAAQVYVNGKFMENVKGYTVSQYAGGRYKVDIEILADSAYVHDNFSETFPITPAPEQIRYKEVDNPAFTIDLTANQIETIFNRSLKKVDNEFDKRWNEVKEEINSRTDKSISDRGLYRRGVFCGAIFGIIASVIANLLL